MYELNGFVKFERKISNWGWYKDVNTFKLFFHLVLFANFSSAEFMGVTIKRGQIARSYSELSAQTGLTEKEIRTAIKHLISTGEVAEERHPKFKVYTIKNYNLYQTMGSQRAPNGQSRGRRGADEGQQIKNDKKNKNDKNMSSSSTRARERENPQPMGGTLGKGVLILTDEQMDELLNIMPLNVFNKYCDKLSNWIVNNGKVVKNHYEQILKWYREDYGGQYE